jgi:hypothetical protein
VSQFTGVCQCANKTVSPKGFTPISCARTVPKPYSFASLGLALSEKQIPKITENTEKPK